ncbi:putative SWI/SNF-related [Phytophthora citrophthora]|uniref:SWI/SNF-related n=1 Tax=Phytophthora citrophthora TaxID=4793 RepID=A0AAD9H2J4_9STRA|nr:putative SWI/SNF-related [Phytophthora citrophthora]
MVKAWSCDFVDYYQAAYNKQSHWLQTVGWLRSKRNLRVSTVRGLVNLEQRGVLRLNGLYVVSPEDTHFGKLRLQIKGTQGTTTLDEFEFVKCHLEGTGEVDICAEKKKATAARRSTCHKTKTPERTRRPVASPVPISRQPMAEAQVKLEIAVPVPVAPERSPTFEMQEEIQEPDPPSSPMVEVLETAVLVKEEGQTLQEPQTDRKMSLPAVFHSLMAQIEAVPTIYVDGLDLKLYEHQRRGLSWMMKRERALLWDTLLLHPFRVPGKQSDTDRKLEIEFSEAAYDACGDMLCDEPGLGKTITMLALILLTKGQSTAGMPLRVDPPTSSSSSVQLRSASRGHSLEPRDMVSSSASLVVAPDALVEHWAEQIERHVVHQGLKIYVDTVERMRGNLPSAARLATFDVVIVSFSRMAKEWRLHRPASRTEKKRTVKYGFEDQPARYMDGRVIGDISPLLLVHWLRIVVDEGHKLGGRAPTQLMQMSRLLCAERRWVMTGTPSPNTLQSTDLQYIHGLLVFLRNLPYGRPDGHSWAKAIALPFENNEVIGFYRLQHLLSRIMIRHTKESLGDKLPRPIRHKVLVEPTSTEFKLYNAVAKNIQARLLITRIDLPQIWKSTLKVILLHRKNYKGAAQVENDLTLALMGGYSIEWTLKKEKMEKTVKKLEDAVVKKKTACTECGLERRFLMVLPCGHLCCAHCIEAVKQELGEPCCNFCGDLYDEDDFDYLQPTCTGEILPRGREKTISKLRQVGVLESRIQRVTEYMDSRQPEPPTECRSCHRLMHLLLIFSCGHMCCTDCTDRRFQEAGPSCCLCHAEYPQKSAAPAAKKAMRLINVKRDFWRIESSKIFYMVARIRDLMKEFMQPSQEQELDLKVIIFSQFRENIWRAKVAFEQQDIPTADFIALVNPRERSENLEKFRYDPGVHVLLLSNLASHGLDLSFVTHIFLLEEIWDKSVEQQVISRAHRMGARHSVVVEQLWIKGTVECQLTSVSENLFKRERCIEGGENEQQKLTREEVQEASSASNSNFQQMKVSYLLNNLRVLDDEVGGEESEVRFSVLDENEAIVHQGMCIISDTGTVTTGSFIPKPSKESVAAAESLSHLLIHKLNQESRNLPAEIIVIDNSSDEEEHKSDSGKEDDARIPSHHHFARVKQEPAYIELDEGTDSE